MKRTQIEILNRIAAIEKDDFFGFQSGDLVVYLDFEHAKQFLKEGTTLEQWAHPFTDPIEKIKEYMPFAWDKANNCRGLSAARSLEHMKAWVWMDDQPALSKLLDNDYEYYGKPHLVAICKHYDIDWRPLDNNKWVNEEGGPSLTAAEALGE